MRRHQIPSSLRARIVELGASVETRFSRHRGVVAGKQVDDNEIKQILRDSEDPDERREAWEASKTVGGEVAEDVRELARMRNEAARSLGHRDWFALSLATDEMDEEKLLDDPRCSRPRDRGAVRALEGEASTRGSPSAFAATSPSSGPGTTPTRSSRSRRPTASVDLDPLFEGKDVVDAREPDVRGHRIRGRRRSSSAATSTRGRARASTRSASTSTAEGDVRVLANVIDNHGWIDTMLHELGHAVYDLGFDDELPWAVRDTHLVTTEASRSSSARWRATASGSSASSGSMRARRTSSDARLRFRASCRAAGLHALGAGHERVRARALRRPRVRSRRRLVGARRPLPAAHASRRPECARLGGEDPRRGRSRLLPHVSLRSDRRVCRSATRCEARPAGSSNGPKRVRSCRSGSSRPGPRSAGTGSSSEPRDARSRSTRSPAKSRLHRNHGKRLGPGRSGTRRPRALLRPAMTL